MVLLAVWVSALGCASAPRVGQIEHDVDAQPVALEIGCGDEASDDVTVRGAELRGATLLVDVTHPGGCGDHTYRVCGAREVLRTEPGQWILTVLHDSRGDACTTRVHRLLSVGLDRHTPVDVSRADGTSVTVLVR